MSGSAGGGAATARSQMSVSKKKSNSLGGCLKAPFRLLRRARDMYVKSLGGCAGAGGGARGGGFAAGVASLMPRARSRSAFGPSNRPGPGEDDFRDLVRASSVGSAPPVNVVVVKRSQSAPFIDRIEEDAAGEEEGEQPDVYDRSITLPAKATAARFLRR